MTAPLQFLREAIRAVPAVKYALGVGGVVAAIAIVYSFNLSPRFAFFGTLIMFILMGVLVIFARMVSLPGTHLALPALVFTWFTLIIFMAVSITLFTSVFFRQPVNLTNWLTGGAERENSEPVVEWYTNYPLAGPPNSIECSCLKVVDHSAPRPQKSYMDFQNLCKSTVSVLASKDNTTVGPTSRFLDPDHPPDLADYFTTKAGRYWSLVKLMPSQKARIDFSGSLGGGVSAINCPI